jgi:flagellin-like protein
MLKGGKKTKMKMKRFVKNAKALSPVVASIILIAVTVAVSIAVAAWMGALTVGFMGSSSITVTNVSFNSGTTIVLTMKNTGTKTVTVGQVKINDVAVATPVWSGNAPNATIATGEIGKTVTLTNAYVSGNPYKFDLVDASGQAVGSYQATAP